MQAHACSRFSSQQLRRRFPDYHPLCSRAEEEANPGIPLQELDQAGGSAAGTEGSLLQDGPAEEPADEMEAG